MPTASPPPGCPLLTPPHNNPVDLSERKAQAAAASEGSDEEEREEPVWLPLVSPRRMPLLKALCSLVSLEPVMCADHLIQQGVKSRVYCDYRLP